jgi:hypothetical protein
VTRIFGHVTAGGEDARKREERDLIAAYNPPMNVQHRTNALMSPAATAAALGRYGALNPLFRSSLGGKMRIPVDREHRFRLIVNINSSRS